MTCAPRERGKTDFGRRQLLPAATGPGGSPPPGRSAQAPDGGRRPVRDGPAGPRGGFPPPAGLLEPRSAFGEGPRGEAGRRRPGQCSGSMALAHRCCQPRGCGRRATMSPPQAPGPGTSGLRGRGGRSRDRPVTCPVRSQDAPLLPANPDATVEWPEVFLYALSGKTHHKALSCGRMTSGGKGQAGDGFVRCRAWRGLARARLRGGVVC